jgi:hypothetical protein
VYRADSTSPTCKSVRRGDAVTCVPHRSEVVMLVAAPTLAYVFMAWRLIKHRNNSALHFKMQGISIPDE